MVATTIRPQWLSARGNNNEHGDWGPIQIATPAIVGGILLLIFAAYIISQRNPPRERPYDYHRVRSDWVTKIKRTFLPRRTRVRVLRSSAPITLDDSMCVPSLALDFRRARQYRSGSSDSQTPLTLTDHTFNHPQNKRLPDPPLPTPKRRALRLWWFFGSRPREIRSEEPGSRWHVDGPDGSSTEHGHGHEANSARYAALEAADEEREETEDDVIQIGENFTNITSTVTQHFPAQTRAAGGMSTVPEFRESTAVSATPSYPGMPVPSANRGFLPSYDMSQSLARYASAENVHSSPPYTVTPPPVHTAGYSSPRVFHVRELSTESFLAAQIPMVAPSTY